VKSQGDYLKDVVMTVDTRKERLVTDFPGQDKRLIFEPKRIVMEKADGALIETRENPEKSFEGQFVRRIGTTFTWPISKVKRCGPI
jgi:hypothetical protein